MAERGRETLRFGPMKPVGLTDPRTGRRPHAVVQLRQDNALGTLYNMVGFQTKLKHAEQVRVFRTIPGLERAEFARLGGLHRNTFVNSPRLLDAHAAPEGGAARPPRRARSPAARAMSRAPPSGSWPAGSPPPRRWARHPCRRRPRPRTGRCSRTSPAAPSAETFQPMNVNFGLFPPPPAGHAQERAQAGHGAPRAGGAQRPGDKSPAAHIAACLARENC